MIRPPTTLFTVSCPPHVHCGTTIRRVMLETILALLPAAVMAVAAFGMPALRVMALSCSVAVLTEAACWKLMGRPLEVDDFNGLLLGLLFSFLLPASAPWWLVAVGSATTIVLGKAIFGGLGGAPLCAPLVGWAALTISWPDAMDIELSMLGTTFAEPMAQLKHFGALAVEDTPLTDLLFGHQLGGLGSSQVLALFLGGAFLIFRGRLRWHIPVTYLLGVAAMAAMFHLMDPEAYATPLFHLLGGATVFGAFFLAPDPSSSPVGRVPMLVFGFLAGVLTMIVRVWGLKPEGVMFAILLANLMTPMLEKLRPKPFGARNKRGSHA